MILYQLKCDKDHRFEGWFRDSAGFEEQQRTGEIACPVCASRTVARAPMAPRIAKTAPEGERQPDTGRGGAGPAQNMAVAGKLHAALQEMRRMIESNADYVGPRFAEEARNIHYGDADERNIYGESTREEAEALEEEGVPFLRVPWPKDDA